MRKEEILVRGFKDNGECYIYETNDEEIIGRILEATDVIAFFENPNPTLQVIVNHELTEFALKLKGKEADCKLTELEFERLLFVLDTSRTLITHQMIDEFNDFLVRQGSVLRLKRKLSDPTGNVVDIVIRQDPFLTENQIPYLNEKFYTVLKEHFGKFEGIKELQFNNTGSTFWPIGR